MRLPLDEIGATLGRVAVTAAPGRSLPASRAVPPAPATTDPRQCSWPWLLELAAQQPVLLIVEDLHWVDPSTLELLSLLVDQVPTAPHSDAADLSARVSPPWGFRAVCDAPRRSPASPSTQVEVMLACVAGGKTLPAEVLPADRRQDRWRPAVRRGVDQDGAGVGPAAGVRGPLRAGGSAAAAGDSRHPPRLPHGAAGSAWRRSKKWPNWGLRWGGRLRMHCCAAVSPLDEETLQQALAQLVEAELLYQRGVPPQATYLFKHALIQEAAYQSYSRARGSSTTSALRRCWRRSFPRSPRRSPSCWPITTPRRACTSRPSRYWQQAGQRAMRALGPSGSDQSPHHRAGAA